MIWRRKREVEQARSIDDELNARLSRLRSELLQARALAEGEAFRIELEQVENHLDEAEALAEKATKVNANDASEIKEKCLLLVQDVEAGLCLVKPAELLYPTWIRLRERLRYRFGKERREAWISDVGDRFTGEEVEELDPRRLQTLRQRLRQLTLELGEAASSYNRLNNERSKVTSDVIGLAVRLLCVFAVSVIACLTISHCVKPGWTLTLVSSVATVSAGGMGAVFSRLRTLQDERLRKQFTKIFRSDLLLRVGVGSGAALLVAAIVLSGRFFALPKTQIEQVAVLVALGFAAGFSERVWKVMLSQATGRSSRLSSKDGN
ncbi:MAG: hypothetical protein F4X40_06185 [Chloroflexi bacterium]|nr:hypothetical protein [Chloroflexota bacterium]